MLLTASGQKPEMPLLILKCTGQLSTTIIQPKMWIVPRLRGLAQCQNECSGATSSPSSLESIVRISFQFYIHKVTLIATKWPLWEHLHHRNQYTL